MPHSLNVMLNVTMLSVIMQGVVAPFCPQAFNLNQAFTGLLNSFKVKITRCSKVDDFVETRYFKFKVGHYFGGT